MRAKSTTAMGKEHEEFVQTLFEWDDAKRSRSSGAAMHDPVDVTSTNLVMECEATEAKSYRLTLDLWREIEGKQHSGKIPALAIRLRDPTSSKHVDLLVLNIHDASMVLETLDAFRMDSLDRD